MLKRMVKYIYDLFFEKGSFYKRAFYHALILLFYMGISYLIYHSLDLFFTQKIYVDYYKTKVVKAFFCILLFHFSWLIGIKWTLVSSVLFTKGSYLKRLLIHLGVFFGYSFLFYGYHQYHGWVIQDDFQKNYSQLLVSRFLVIIMIIHLILVIIIQWKVFLRLVKEYFLEPGSAAHLAIFRIFFFYLLGSHLLFSGLQDQISWTYLPYESRVGLPFIHWLVYSIPITPSIFYISTMVAGVLSFLICLGVFSRYFIFLLIPFLFYSLGVPLFYGKISHEHIFLWICLFLCFSPLGDRFSVDAYIRKRKKKYSIPQDHPKYMVAFKFIWLQMAIIYLFAGIIKLWDCGFNWAVSDSMIYQMQWEWVEHYDKVPGFRIDHYPWLAKLGGLGVIYFELLYVFLIIKPKGRVWAFLGAFSLHKLSGYFMYIDFVKLRQIQLLLLRWDKAGFWILNKMKKGDSKNLNGPLLTTVSNGKLRPVFFIGSIVLIINFAFSVFKIHSYPFSSYPTYSAIVKNEVSLLRMDVFDSYNNPIDIKKIGKENNFRWENIRPYEIRIIDIFKNKDTSDLQLKLNEYWLLWANNFEELNEVKKVDMFEDVTELAPEKRNTILRTEYIGTVYPEKINR